MSINTQQEKVARFYSALESQKYAGDQVCGHCLGVACDAYTSLHDAEWLLMENAESADPFIQGKDQLQLAFSSALTCISFSAFFLEGFIVLYAEEGGVSRKRATKLERTLEKWKEFPAAVVGSPNMQISIVVIENIEKLFNKRNRIAHPKPSHMAKLVDEFSIDATHGLQTIVQSIMGLELVDPDNDWLHTFGGVWRKEVERALRYPEL